MAKVVYLLGAGASAGKERSCVETFSVPQLSKDGVETKLEYQCPKITSGVPMVVDIPQRLRYVAYLLRNRKDSDEELNHTIFPLGKWSGAGYEDVKDRLIKDFETLANNCERHATIDTYAKKLFLTKEKQELEKLKKLLSIFLIIEQYLNEPDTRYDTFLANVLTNALTLPNEIAILSWNYDSQIEIAYREYNKANPSTLGVYNEYVDKPENPKVFKLNGTAQFDGINPLSVWCDRNKHTIDEFKTKFVMDEYWKTNSLSMLAFAWENDRVKDVEKTQRFWETLQNEVADVECLVVIGYTFPYFNRMIDRWVLDKMPNLRQIYIQAPNAEILRNNVIPVLSERQIKINHLDKNTIPISNCEQFYLPPQL